MEQGVSAQFEIKPIDASLVDASFDLASAVFAASSSLHSALDVTLQDYRAYLRAPFVAMIAEGLSVAALDRASGAMAVGDQTTDQANPRITAFNWRRSRMGLSGSSGVVSAPLVISGANRLSVPILNTTAMDIVPV